MCAIRLLLNHPWQSNPLSRKSCKLKRHIKTSRNLMNSAPKCVRWWPLLDLNCRISKLGRTCANWSASTGFWHPKGMVQQSVYCLYNKKILFLVRKNSFWCESLWKSETTFFFKLPPTYLWSITILPSAEDSIISVLSNNTRHITHQLRFPIGPHLLLCASIINYLCMWLILTIAFYLLYFQ